MKNNRAEIRTHLLPLLMIPVCAAVLPRHVTAADYYPPGLLNIAGSGQTVTNEELSVFRDNDVAEGNYDVTLFINKVKITRMAVPFVLMTGKEDKETLQPCFTEAQWHAFGIIFPDNTAVQTTQDGCVNLSGMDFISGDLDLNNQIYSLTVPQSQLNQDKIRSLEEKNWDNGIPAAFVNYNFSAFNQRNRGNTQDSYYGNIRTRVNIGAWRYKNYTVWTHNQSGGDKWNTISNTISRNINPIKSEIAAGNLYTSSQLFDGVKIRGVNLKTDRIMEPADNRSYVPVISGMANSEAVVSIVQNGETIFRQTVPAGPFSITQYYPMSNGGNLYVTVKETDGAENQFIVPFSTIANLERKGGFRYAVSAGQYDSSNDGDGIFLSQAEAFYGATDYITLYGGTFIAADYHSAGLGTALNMGTAGAVTTDILHARTRLNDEKTISGNAFRINYAKRIESTNTSLTLAGYRHFDTGFYRFEDAAARKEYQPDQQLKLKNEYTLTLNQPVFSDRATLNLTSVIYQYGNGQTSRSYNAGFNSDFSGISYGVYYTYSQGNQFQEQTKNNQSLSINLSVPLSFGDYPVRAAYNLSTDNNHQTQQTARLNGNFGEHSQGSWDVYQGYTNQGSGYSGGISSSYQSSYAVMNAGYSYSQDNKNLSYGISGALVATQYGMLAAPDLQETNALVLTKDAAGVGVINGRAIKTNHAGLALVSGMTPYRKNNISIDTRTLPDDVEIENNISGNMIPTKGALILADFNTKKGYKLLLRLKTADDREIPLGAEAVMTGAETQLVSGFNNLYFLTEQPAGEIRINWKQDGAAHTCSLHYDTAHTVPVNGLYIADADCRTGSQ